MPIWQRGIWICWSSIETSKHPCALSQSCINVINMFLCRNISYYVMSIDNPIKSTNSCRCCSQLSFSWCVKMGFVKILRRKNLHGAVPVVMELHANPCSLPADVFAWGNVLACARMIAKMRRQWQRPILFYFMFFCSLLVPGALRNFACVFLWVNFLRGCLSLRWWEKGWGLCAVHLEEASDGHRAVEWRIRQRACS